MGGSAGNCSKSTGAGIPYKESGRRLPRTWQQSIGESVNHRFGIAHRDNRCNGYLLLEADNSAPGMLQRNLMSSKETRHGSVPCVWHLVSKRQSGEVTQLGATSQPDCPGKPWVNSERRESTVQRSPQKQGYTLKFTSDQNQERRGIGYPTIPTKGGGRQTKIRSNHDGKRRAHAWSCKHERTRALGVTQIGIRQGPNKPHE